jgi:D-alanyl-D-alanine carboxypeptidase/D-alanyl-D-alanine-endopeptidase (penicillin-binding protein 4)
MRRLALLLAASVIVLGVASGPAAARATHAAAAARRSLDSELAGGMSQAGRASGGYVEDLSTGVTLYANRSRVGRLPASVEKLYTASTALLRFGSGATLSTQVLATGGLQGSTFVGTLYLRGGGDPTFGSAGFVRTEYGAGATIQQLVAKLVKATGMNAFRGNVVADESMLDSLRGTPATGYGTSIDVEGELSALAFNRGWADAYGYVYYKHPAVEAGQQLVAALKAARVHVPGTTRIRAGVTPSGAAPLARVLSPPMAKLVSLTNTPSDNFFAETLIKDLGAGFGAGGTTAAGAGVVRATIAEKFGLHPRFNDGSGLSRYDRTSPFDVVSLLRQQANNPQFVDSLAVAGRTGTLKHEMRRTYAQGRCRGKTGTLTDASNLVGYCHARAGHTLAFAFLMNNINPDYAHPIQNRMVVAMARYNG